jgi:gliding motility-associated-like protein
MILKTCSPGPLPAILLVLAFARVNGQTASFTMPSSVCTNVPVNIVNTSTGGSTYFWSFCSADLTQPPQAVNLGQLTNPPQEPVFIEIVEENNNYYGLMTIHYPGNLARLDFGNSLLNTPIVTDLGNFGGILNPTFGTEGIQVVHSNGRWYAIIVGGSSIDINPGERPNIVKIDFGATITNPAPVATDWGNLGMLQLPIQFYMFQEGGLWYGYTVNCESNTLTRFDFGASFANPPAAINLGNPGGLLSYPCGIYPINDGGFWRIFISNGQPNISNTLVRLDFGNSLLNPPTPVNLGNPGNVIISARAMAILKDCDQAVGFLTDGQAHSLIRLDFHNDITSIPTATNLGNLAGWNFPHSLSRIFRVGADLYTFVPDAFTGTITRLRFPGCTSASIPSSNLFTPPAISWSQPGTYRVNLTMDEGLPTETAYCQSILVGQAAPFTLGNDTTLCTGDSLILRYSGPPATYQWQDGSSQDTFTVRSPGKYAMTAVQTIGCSSSGAIQIAYLTRPVISTLADTAICFGSSVQLTTQIAPADSVRWTPTTGLSSATATSPVVTPGTTASYIVTAWHGQCPSKDTVNVDVLPLPTLNISADTLICMGATARLTASGAVTYSWSPATGLSDPGIANPLASPASTVKYFVQGVGANHCNSLDSVQIVVKPPDVFGISASPAAICPGDSSTLTATGGDMAVGDTYTWRSFPGLPDPNAAAIAVSPTVETSYTVMAFDKVCNQTDTLNVNVDVLASPVIAVTKSNDIGCIFGESTLTATGGVRYEWTPAGTLSDPYSSVAISRTDTTTQYAVLATGADGCVAKDTITVFVSNAGSGLGFPVANAFTPNGDGKNDRFEIKYWGYISDFQLSVFNRWGQLLFSTADPDRGWDGTYNGKPQPTGTYVYVVRATTLCGVGYKKGTVELIR